MILVTGWYNNTGLTGTIYEPEERKPSYNGSPDFGNSYVWVCDSFYEVESGGITQELESGNVQFAFERPVKKGFEEYESSISGAKDHIRTQFSRIGLSDKNVEFDIEEYS